MSEHMVEIIREISDSVHAFYCEGEKDETCAQMTEQIAQMIKDILTSAGYCIVPMEPTEAMRDAAMKAVFDGTSADIRDQTIYETSAFGSAYRAMITAAKGE